MSEAEKRSGVLERRHVMLPRQMLAVLERVQDQTKVFGKEMSMAQIIREVIQDGLELGRYKGL